MKTSEKAILIVAKISQVLNNFSCSNKIAICMVYSDHFFVIPILKKLLSSNIPSVEAKRAASMCCFNLITNCQTSQIFLSDSDFLLFILKRYVEKDFSCKHTLAKALNSAVKESNSSALKKIIEENLDIGFIEWMIRSVGCDEIQVLVLRLFIDGKWIISDREQIYSKSIISSLLSTFKETISTAVKSLCGEAIFHFSSIDRFKKEIIDNNGHEMLVPQLSYKDAKSKSFAVQTLARLCMRKETALFFVKHCAMVRPAVNCFLMTSATDLSESELLLGSLKILSNISDTTEFRVYFIHSGAINKLLNILEDSKSDPPKLILCLNIIIAFVNSGKFTRSTFT